MKRSMIKELQMNRFAMLLAGIALVVGAPAAVQAGITVTSKGPMAQLNTAGLPGTHIRDLSTIWNASNGLEGTMFFCQSATTPLSIMRATTTDGGLTWTAGVDTALANPSTASGDERNPVVRDFARNGGLTGFFGTRQGVYSDYNNVLFRAASANNGVSWTGEALVSFGTGAFPGHTGLNGFIEVFKTSTGILRGYVALNNLNDSPSSATHRVESSNGGATWTDMGSIAIPGPGDANNVVGANGPVFKFTDVESDQSKMGWFLYGEGTGNRGVNLLISSDEGLSWALGGFSFLDSALRSGDARFISDSEVRLFYYRNTGTIPSDRQLWYEDFRLSGMSSIQPNNLYVPEPATLVLLAAGGVGMLLRRKRNK